MKTNAKDTKVDFTGDGDVLNKTCCDFIERKINPAKMVAIINITANEERNHMPSVP